MPVDINRLDRRAHLYSLLYRATLLILAIVSTVGVLVGVHEVFVVSNRVDLRTQEINQHINCELSLFTQPNRTTLTINDITNCTLVRK